MENSLSSRKVGLNISSRTPFSSSLLPCVGHRIEMQVFNMSVADFCKIQHGNRAANSAAKHTRRERRLVCGVVTSFCAQSSALWPKASAGSVAQGRFQRTCACQLRAGTATPE